MDRHTKEQRSKNMRAVKSKGSKIENVLAKAMWGRGIRYRRNVQNIFGKPDFALKKYKLAIFCDSEFWHGKDWDTKKKEIKSNKEFWYNKIESNIKRDKNVNLVLTSEGWIVLRFWGKEIIKNTEDCVDKIDFVIKKQKV